MALLSQALHLGYLLSPHSAFQGHAAHTARWPAMLSPNGSSDTCISDGVFHIPMPCFHGAIPVYPQVLPHSSRLLHGAAHAPTPMPLPTPQEGLGISYGSRLPTSTCLGILPEVSRVHTVGLKRDDVGGVFLDAPSALCGSRDCLQGRTRFTCTVPITLTTCAMSNPTASIYD